MRMSYPREMRSTRPIASVAAIKARLSAFLKESEEGPVVVTRNGKAVAVLLAVSDEDAL